MKKLIEFCRETYDYFYRTNKREPAVHGAAHLELLCHHLEITFGPAKVNMVTEGLWYLEFQSPVEWTLYVSIDLEYTNEYRKANWTSLAYGVHMVAGEPTNLTISPYGYAIYTDNTKDLRQICRYFLSLVLGWTQTMHL